MRCQEVREWMSLELDGCLPAEDARKMEAHLAACPVCAAQWAEWREIASLFEAAPLAEPPADLTERVMARIQTKPRHNAPLLSLVVMVAGLALLAVLALSPVVDACGTALRAAQLPGMLSALSSVLAALCEIVAMLAEAARTVLRALLTPGSALIALGYAAVLLAALAGWLRLVFRPAQSEA